MSRLGGAAAVAPLAPDKSPEVIIMPSSYFIFQDYIFTWHYHFINEVQC